MCVVPAPAVVNIILDAMHKSSFQSYLVYLETVAPS